MGFEAQTNVVHGLLCLEESRVTNHPVGLGPGGGGVTVSMGAGVHTGAS